MYPRTPNHYTIAQYLLLVSIISHPNVITTYPIDHFFCALVAGYGFGLTSALVTYISTLVQMIGPGVIMCPSCPSTTLFFISAINTSLTSLQHITWMMIAFEAYLNLPTLSGILQGTWVLISHFGVSYAVGTLLFPLAVSACI